MHCSYGDSNVCDSIIEKRSRFRNGRLLTDGVTESLSMKPPGQELTFHQSPNLHLRMQRGHLQVGQETATSQSAIPVFTEGGEKGCSTDLIISRVKAMNAHRRRRDLHRVKIKA